MNTSPYRLKYVLVGASGSGKTTMAKVLEKALGLRRCITSTTRPPRPGETDGKDYYFCSVFDPGQMFEQASFGGYLYGITYNELLQGDFIILDPQGVRYYREHYPAPLTVIQLQRSNICVDDARMARDKAAGFDSVCPDFTVTGDSVDAMATSLLRVIALTDKNKTSRSLDEQISSAENYKKVYETFAAEHLHEPDCIVQAPFPVTTKEQERA